jgi:hypothetical protein
MTGQFIDSNVQHDFRYIFTVLPAKAARRHGKVLATGLLRSLFM